MDPLQISFYRVVQESKTLAGLWVGYYDNCCYGLVQVTMNGDEAVATWLIAPEAGYDLVGKVDWEADVTSGVGTGLTDHGAVSCRLKVISPDRITIQKTGLSTSSIYRRVD